MPLKTELSVVQSETTAFLSGNKAIVLAEPEVDTPLKANQPWLVFELHDRIVLDEQDRHHQLVDPFDDGNDTFRGWLRPPRGNSSAPPKIASR
ncbi:hypothetical protein GGD66_007836 [Bradyrhizobium sp. CIR48]|uniref:hypothetical protein n=1 Tax=Bradyrhizobium sp. CIR48 TaxID=2663840 RepID=UPI0016056490|nr:hypothetical protein [Bradyrhizobium sp. CIR48]MBB4429236.1 hypothetical protein [Bradyrhizobium sp. CIR48]